MKTGGSGGANTNASGKPFEECFRPTGTRVIGGKVFEYIDQDNFVEHMKELKDPQWEHKKKPDGAFVSEDKKTVFIIECKHQIVSGSVDEKLRAGPCLLTEYNQLYPTVDNIYMMFIVNEWWFLLRLMKNLGFQYFSQNKLVRRGRFIFKKMPISGQYIQLIMELMKKLFLNG